MPVAPLSVCLQFYSKSAQTKSILSSENLSLFIRCPDIVNISQHISHITEQIGIILLSYKNFWFLTKKIFPGKFNRAPKPQFECKWVNSLFFCHPGQYNTHVSDDDEEEGCISVQWTMQGGRIGSGRLNQFGLWIRRATFTSCTTSRRTWFKSRVRSGHRNRSCLPVGESVAVGKQLETAVKDYESVPSYIRWLGAVTAQATNQQVDSGLKSVTKIHIVLREHPILPYIIGHFSMLRNW